MTNDTDTKNPPGRPKLYGDRERFVLMLDTAFVEQLRTESARLGLSINEYCTRGLAFSLEITTPCPSPFTTKRRSRKKLENELINACSNSPTDNPEPA